MTEWNLWGRRTWRPQPGLEEGDGAWLQAQSYKRHLSSSRTPRSSTSGPPRGSGSWRERRFQCFEGGGGALQGVEPPQLQFHHYELPSRPSSGRAFPLWRLFRQWAFSILTPWRIFPKGVWMGPRFADSHCFWWVRWEGQTAHRCFHGKL